MNDNTIQCVTKWKGLLALSPMMVFLIAYLVSSIYIGDFYKMPISVAFIIAAIWATLTTPKLKLASRIDIFTTGAADAGIMYMIMIFILAGAFATLATEIGAVDATVNLTLRVLPNNFIIPGLFVATCFVSMSIGTSVGTIVALTPFAIQLAEATGSDPAFTVAVVIGGSFFGDNLSFISDTTIAATRSQDCRMSDKFKANLLIAVPASVIALTAYIMTSHVTDVGEISGNTSLWLVLPYIIVIAMAISGMNVLLVLVLGIFASVVAALFVTDFGLMDMCSFMGDGILGMGNLIVVTLLAGGLLNVIKHNGGIAFILQWLASHINGRRGAMASIALLVGLVNICTANNTIAIITVGQLAKRISDQYNLEPRTVASILDTCSCIVQCLIPYGAQILLAAGMAHLSPVAFIPYLFYAWSLALMVVLSIVFRFPQKISKN